MMRDKEYSSNNRQTSQEKNIFGKTIVSVLAAGAIAAFSLVASYSLVTTFQPASELSYAALTCGEKKGDDEPKVSTNTCGEDKDKDGGGDKTIDA